MLERPLREPVPEISPKINVTIAQATIDDLPRFKDIVDVDKYGRLRERFRRGQVCFAVYDAERIIGFSWISFDDEYDADVDIKVETGDHEAYLYDSYVDSEYRGNRLYTSLLARKLNYLATRNFNRAIIFIAVTNLSSLRGALSVGFNPYRTVTTYRFFNTRLHRWREYNGVIHSQKAGTEVADSVEKNQHTHSERELKASPLHTEEVTDMAAFASLRETWNALLQKCPDNNVFLTWEWLFMWWRHHGEGKKLRILLVKDSDNIIGIAPLMQWRYRKWFFGINVVENLCAEECDYSGVVLTERAEEAIAALLNHLRKIAVDEKSVVRLWHIPADSYFLKALHSQYPAFSQALALREEICSQCFVIGLPDSWDEFRGNIGRRTRKNLRRFRNLMEDNYRVEFRKHADGDNLETDLEPLFHLHQKKWNQTDTPSKFDEPRERDFYLDVSRAFRENGWLDLSFLKLDGRVVSSEWGFNYAGTYWSMTGSFDTDYARYSPGNVHTMELIKSAIDSGQKRYDMLKGLEDYKSHWSEKKRNNSIIVITANSLRAHNGIRLLNALIALDNSRGRSLWVNTYFLLRKLGIIKKYYRED